MSAFQVSMYVAACAYPLYIPLWCLYQLHTYTYVYDCSVRFIVEIMVLAIVPIIFIPVFYVLARDENYIAIYLLVFVFISTINELKFDHFLRVRDEKIAIDVFIEELRRRRQHQ